MYQFYPESCIDDFQIYELLGKGGFAHVYRAKSLHTGQDVAIKMINKKTIASQPGLANRVRREVEIHSRLKHSSILELYTCFEDNNHVYLVLELCPYGELQSYIRDNGPVNEDYARRILSQILHGILYLHAHHILHRDLSLANLLLNREKKIKIADFGLATRIEPGSESMHKTMCGTPNYISPEIANKQEQSLESDVWSIGCMLYILLVGRPPFEGKELKNTLKKVTECDYHIPGNLSPAASDLISKLLRKNPQDRISIRAIFQHPFMLYDQAAMNSCNGNSGITVKSDNVSRCDLFLSKMDRSQDSGIDSMSRTPSHGIFPSQKTSMHYTSLSNGMRRSISANINQKTTKPQLSISKNVLKKLNTNRLISIRSCTRVASMSIQKDGSVLGQFFSLERSKEGIVVARVMWISPNGNHIIYYQPNSGHGVLWKHPKTQIVHAMDNDFYEEYSFENLPPMYHKDYKNLAKFVSTVRSSTPKVILYTPHGKCMLMEYDEDEPKIDFIATFNRVSPSGSVKDSIEVKFLGDESNIKISHNSDLNSTPNNSMITLNVADEFSINALSEDHKRYLADAQTYRERCIELEKTLKNLSLSVKDSCVYFPAVFGRNEGPMVQPLKSTSTPRNSVNLPQSILSLVGNATKKISLTSIVKSKSNDHVTSVEENMNNNSNKKSNGHNVNDPIFVPKVGWAVKSNPDTLDINFNDGARLSISYNSEEISRIRFAPPEKSNASSTEYTTGSKIPSEVHSRLEAVPAVVRYLRSQHQEQAKS